MKGKFVMIDGKFVEVIYSVFPQYKGDVLRETTAAEVPGWDSFGHVQLIFEIEDTYSIQIDPAQSLLCPNIGALYDLVQGLLDE